MHAVIIFIFFIALQVALLECIPVDGASDYYAYLSDKTKVAYTKIVSKRSRERRSRRTKYVRKCIKRRGDGKCIRYSIYGLWLDPAKKGNSIFTQS